MKTKTGLGMFILLLSLGFSLILCAVDKKAAHASFGIYLVEDGSLLLSDEDIDMYIKAEHKLVLNQNGIRKWNSPIRYDSSHTPPTPKVGGLYQKEFVVKLENEVMYRGKFWSIVSSQSYDGIVILDATIPCDSKRKSLTIENGYASTVQSPKDLRENEKIFNFFNSKGKLQ